jgi:hypothetical protein
VVARALLVLLGRQSGDGELLPARRSVDVVDEGGAGVGAAEEALALVVFEQT